MKILLYAYTHGNFGDDLLMRIVVQRYPEAEFISMASGEQIARYQATSDFRNVYWTKRDGFHRMVSLSSRLLLKRDIFLNRIAKKSDITVYVGGSIFKQQRYWKYYYWYLFSLLKASKRFLVIDANFGPYHSANFFRSFYRVISRADDVCFRDRRSFNLFKDVGGVRLASDLAFSLDVGEFHDKFSNRVFLSCISLKSRPALASFSEEYHAQLNKLIIQFVNHGYSVEIASFCAYENDPDACDTLYHSLPDDIRKNVDLLQYENDIDNVIHHMSKSSIIIATRFHAIVLGWLLQKNVIPIIYEEKTQNLIADVGYTGLSYDIKRSLDFSIEKILHNSRLPIELLKKAIEMSNDCLCRLDQEINMDSLRTRYSCN